MRKYIYRLLIAVLAFFVSATIVYFSIWDSIKNLVPAQIASYNHPIHSAENNSLYSILEGTIVRIKPYDATFEIPESWINYKPISIEPPKNLYLSWQDLNELERFDFNHPLGFDKKDAQIMRSALPFEDCAAHIGSMSWGNGNTNDLQTRVFIVASSSQEVIEKIKNQGVSKAQSVFDEAELVSENYGNWGKQKMHVLETGSHTLLFKDITFYHRSFGNKTVVFVFVHQSGWDEMIKKILDSFKLAN
jgi:hypothetical protein